MCINWSPLAVFAVVFLLPGVWQLSRQLLALRWSSTPGIVIDYIARRRLGPDDTVFYEASPTYSYHVDGKSFVGDRLSYADTSEGTTHENALASMRTRYPVGSAVVVYYDPADPGRCVLQRDINYVGPLISVVGAGVFAVAGRMFSC